MEQNNNVTQPLTDEQLKLYACSICGTGKILPDKLQVKLYRELHSNMQRAISGVLQNLKPGCFIHISGNLDKTNFPLLNFNHASADECAYLKTALEGIHAYHWVRISTLDQYERKVLTPETEHVEK